MGKQRIILRADGNAGMGWGHISRCLGLAEILSQDFQVSFAIQMSDQSRLGMSWETFHKVIRLPIVNPSSEEFIHELDQHLSGNEIVVLDGYHFNTTYEEHLKKMAAAVVCVDDIPSRRFVADAVINFNGCVKEEEYIREFDTQLFLGSDYLFLRAPFLRKASGEKKFSNSLFLNMGGGDSNNHTMKILTELSDLRYSGKIEVVVGESYPHRVALESICKGSENIILHQGLSAEEMYLCMQRCALAIVPPSTVALEFLSTGGLAFLYQTADNQALQRKFLIGGGLAFDYREFNTMTSTALAWGFEEAVKKEIEIFNGSSLERLRKTFQQIGLASQLRLRRATLDDMTPCFNWANEPEVRKYSFTTTPIAWDQHQQWFHKKLADVNCYYFIAEVGEIRAGQIRFDFLIDEETHQISYALDPHFRGKGLSYSLLAKGIRMLEQKAAVKNVVGYVQEQNVASIKAFQRLGFDMQADDTHPGSFRFLRSFTLL